MFDGMVGRLPVFDRGLEVFGYELRFCGREALRGGGGGVAGPETLREASHCLPLDDLVGGSRALVRVPSEGLAACAEWGWPKERVVLAVPGAVAREAGLGAVAGRLADLGYAIALCDPAGDPGWLRREAAYVSLCLFDADRLPAGAAGWPGGHGLDPRCLVAGVGTRDQFERCVKLGFHYFQGAFVERPGRLRGPDIPGNRLALLELLSTLQNPDISIAEAETLIGRDMVLSYKLLRLINSAFFGLGKPVESIRRAVLVFGLGRVKNWASVILMNSVDYQPRELLAMATLRARTCESLAQHLKRPDPEHYYLAGLFSLLDAVMDLPREQILSSLNLPAPVDAALLEGAGPVGEALRLVLAFERADPAPLVAAGLADVVPAHLYLDAIRWSRGLGAALAPA